MIGFGLPVFNCWFLLLLLRLPLVSLGFEQSKKQSHSPNSTRLLLEFLRTWLHWRARTLSISVSFCTNGLFLSPPAEMCDTHRFQLRLFGFYRFRIQQSRSYFCLISFLASTHRLVMLFSAFLIENFHLFCAFFPFLVMLLMRVGGVWMTGLCVAVRRFR